jgi:hypothetical protein
VILDGSIEIVIRRDISYYQGPLEVQYATSDITAIGVDRSTFANCLRFSEGKRPIKCGDYLHTYGILKFLFGQSSVSVKIILTPNNCKYAYSRYGQVSKLDNSVYPIELNH